MKKVATLIIVFSIALCSLAACGVESYDDGYEDGYDDGYDEGWNEGFDDGYDECLSWDNYEGSDDYEGGYDAGYEDGYAEGEYSGYYAGATYTCLYFGDVDRAFQCANNGCTWYTFIDAYDQYVSNIFDDDDTRINLVWSLISVTLSEDADEEEIDLLISTFGEDLFIRNGINLHEGG